jgi:hypothetical protein
MGMTTTPMTTMIVDVDVDVDVDAALSFGMRTLSDRHQIMKKTISASDTASDSSDLNYSLLLSFYDGEDYEASLSVSLSVSMSISMLSL